MARRKRGPVLTEGQRQARDEIRRIAGEYPERIEIIDEPGLDKERILRIVIRLPTKDLDPVPSGLPLSTDHEDVTIWIPPGFPYRPPDAVVTHSRFVSQPHVLQGHRLCVYLDPAREWHPAHGMLGFLTRLWDWLDDGAAGRFDAATALFHPVGGVLHRTPGTPTIVVRKPLQPNGKTFLRAALTARTPDRIDVIDWDTRRGATEVALVIVLHAPLSYGAGTTLPGMFRQIAATGHPRPDDIAAVLAQTAARNPPGTPLYVILAVPHVGGASGHHLIAARLPPTFADLLRAVAARDGPLLQINSSSIPADTPIEWCNVSDERSDVNIRRDSSRPTSQFAGKVVEVWGCGGLGSWIAEFLARAGTARLVLRDPGDVHGGLLVRQNYVENDIGRNKAQQLAERLRQISDDLVVESSQGAAPSGLDGPLPGCDVIIDATVNTAVGVYLDLAARQLAAARPLLAQVATDLRTATLGLLTVSAPGLAAGPASIDDQAGPIVLNDGHLERFHMFWQEPAIGDEIVPARGCSVPTFHGSAADIAAVGASLVSLLALHLNSGASGTHLVALPHAPGDGPCHYFLPVADTGARAAARG